MNDIIKKTLWRIKNLYSSAIFKAPSHLQTTYFIRTDLSLRLFFDMLKVHVRMSNIRMHRTGWNDFWQYIKGRNTCACIVILLSHYCPKPLHTFLWNTEIKHFLCRKISQILLEIFMKSKGSHHFLCIKMYTYFNLAIFISHLSNLVRNLW